MDNNSFFAELSRFAIIALVVVFPIRLFVAQPFIVSGASMEPTFENGQYLIVDQLSYYIDEPSRGDVVIFRYPRNPSMFFIKRVIALPGETIHIADGTVTITNDAHKNGMTLDEPYLDGVMVGVEDIVTTLDEGEYFVMGDNRDESSDSRTWGVLARDHIIGRAFLRLLPITEASIFPGAYTATTD